MPILTMFQSILSRFGYKMKVASHEIVQHKKCQWYLKWYLHMGIATLFVIPIGAMLWWIDVLVLRRRAKITYRNMRL